jgi:hypothetical protein
MENKIKLELEKLLLKIIKVYIKVKLMLLNIDKCK